MFSGLSNQALRELAEHEHHEGIIAQGADPNLSADPKKDEDTFSIYSDLTYLTRGRVNSTGSKLFYDTSMASTPSTLCPEGAPDYQQELTEDDMATYENLEECQYNEADEVLTAHDGSDDPITSKYFKF